MYISSKRIIWKRGSQQLLYRQLNSSRLVLIMSDSPWFSFCFRSSNHRHVKAPTYRRVNPLRPSFWACVQRTALFWPCVLRTVKQKKTFWRLHLHEEEKNTVCGMNRPKIKSFVLCFLMKNAPFKYHIWSAYDITGCLCDAHQPFAYCVPCKKVNTGYEKERRGSPSCS